ncbi:MAG: hypothetical protein WDW38_002173 [Sanguina aurantia]
MSLAHRRPLLQQSSAQSNPYSNTNRVTKGGNIFDNFDADVRIDGDDAGQPVQRDYSSAEYQERSGQRWEPTTQDLNAPERPAWPSSRPERPDRYIPLSEEVVYDSDTYSSSDAEVVRSSGTASYPPASSILPDAIIAEPGWSEGSAWNFDALAPEQAEPPSHSYQIYLPGSHLEAPFQTPATSTPGRIILLRSRAMSGEACTLSRNGGESPWDPTFSDDGAWGNATPASHDSSSGGSGGSSTPPPPSSSSSANPAWGSSPGDSSPPQGTAASASSNANGEPSHRYDDSSSSSSSSSDDPGLGDAYGPALGDANWLPGGASGRVGYSEAESRAYGGRGFDGGGFRSPGGQSGDFGRGRQPPPPASSGYMPGMVPSDITLLSTADSDAILPLPPTGRQADFYKTKTVPEQVVELAASIGVSVILSKSALMAAPALLYPVWRPWIRAGIRNLQLFSTQFRYIGLWRTQLLDWEVLGVTPYPASLFSPKPPSSVRLVVGDPWDKGATVQLQLPYQPRVNGLMVGEPVELMVLGSHSGFNTFKAVSEVYLPEAGLWLSEYPMLNKDAFLQLSLEIEKTRRMGPAPQSQQYTS